MRRTVHEQDRPSRTARKKEALAVTELAHQVAGLPEATFRRLPLATEVRNDFIIARGLKASGARDRLLRHLSALLRDDEELLAAVRDTLGGFDRRQQEESRLFHRLEGLRNRLLEPETASAALDEVRRDFPSLDLSALQRALTAQRNGDKGAYRTIFRLLRDAAPPADDLPA